jgi:hypothetical protein
LARDGRVDLYPCAQPGTEAGVPQQFRQLDPGVDLLSVGSSGIDAERADAVAQTGLDVETAEHLLLEIVDDLPAFGGGKPSQPVISAVSSAVEPRFATVDRTARLTSSERICASRAATCASAAWATVVRPLSTRRTSSRPRPSSLRVRTSSTRATDSASYSR